ncbi:hypothetical protein DICVIV_08994 [Dictyocaulus viviparus]|uniref:Chondroitin proteoglycan 4 domain-containing protein n=1 Tax=Dictyocaulus viviparus TaxID=29172 RepID=A0A0D8XMI0_DICVI|nr:hypothetical protein DICVIV_08994 [Dictyocaulus viviparus]
MMKTYDYIEKHRDICRAYKEATFCVAEEHRRCGESDEMFNVISSGMKYVCVEQRNAFNSFIACINREAHSIQTGDLLGQLRSSVARRAHTVGVTSMPYKQDLDVGQDSMRDKTPNTNSLRTFEDVVDQACVYGECALGCLRNKFNMKCEENVGSLISNVCSFLAQLYIAVAFIVHCYVGGFYSVFGNECSFSIALRPSTVDSFNISGSTYDFLICVCSLMRIHSQSRTHLHQRIFRSDITTSGRLRCFHVVKEALIRPLVEGHQKFSPLFIAFGVIAPKSCSFLYKGSSLLRHRIDPEVNDALLTKYGRAESVDINEDKDYTDDTNEMADQMKFRSIDAESDLEHFINIIYGNGTLEEAKILNATFLEEDNILQPSSGQSESTSSALENDTLFDIVLNEGSGHLDEIVVFRATLPTDMLSFEFTPNISGTFQCRIIPVDDV